MPNHQPFCPPQRHLFGPGPSQVPASVLQAMSRPLVGHLDPSFVACMEEVKAMLRQVFMTKNEMTFPVSGTGSAGMEFCFMNLIEPGDSVLVCVNGVFGTRMCAVAERCGARVTKLEVPWGKIIDPEQVAAALKRAQPKVVALVHAETSTGVLSPVEEIAPLARAHGALLILDTVTSLGGCPVRIDDWEVDAAFSGTQKCLSCPPGLSPVSLSPRAMAVARSRKRPVQSWYLDGNLLSSYWGQERTYHHTAPISMIYALHEALRLVLDEGLERRWQRHHQNHLALVGGLQDLGLQLASQKGHQLWQLNCVTVPGVVDEAAIRGRLLKEFNIEIGAGLGSMKGTVWRIGLMGEGAKRSNVSFLLESLATTLDATRRAEHKGLEQATCA
jgi:alanine-glyoxylate transaminase / serine-glyoxylate transaminase / serine-pyruvate transaminase